MIDYSRCTLEELILHQEFEQDRLDINPLDASANARWKHLEQLINEKLQGSHSIAA